MHPRVSIPAAMLAAMLVSAPAGVATAQTPSGEDMSRAMRALSAQPVIDGHNDLPWQIRDVTGLALDVDAYDLRKRTSGHTDLERLRMGRVGGQFWSIYIPGERDDDAYVSRGGGASTPGYARVQIEQIDIARRVIEKYPELEWALTADSIVASIRRGRVGSLLGLEGGHAIENSLALLRVYYDLGARYMTLTHNVTLDWADAALDSARHGGLTGFGREVVREMNRLGMLVDLSHVSPATMSDALDVSASPVIFSHSSARGLADHPRNVPDSILARLPRNGGVVMVTFVPGFISRPVMDYERRRDGALDAARARHGSDTAAAREEIARWNAANPRPRATIADVADHIERVRRMASVDNVGIGSDFDGISDTPVGLEDVSTFPALFAELARRGWSEADLVKLAGGNVLRILRENERVAANLRRERPASTATLEKLDRRQP